MSDGYLLDTNVISALANARSSQHAQFAEIIRKMKHVWLPVVAIAEIECGIAKTENPDARQQAAMRAFFQTYPQPLPFGYNTVEPYSLLRAQIWKTHGTKAKRGHKERLPEELIDRTTGKDLGIDERDLLIASIAAENGLILVTADSAPGMKIIEQAGQELAKSGRIVNLRIHYLAVTPQTGTATIH
jgi:predicted nucleic acid-binding protein